MKQLRNWIPVLGIIALGVLFLKLPEVSKFFTCKSCLSSGPYLPLIGAGYFALLVAIAMLFPSFPSLHTARGGLIWSLLLALTLIYLRWTQVCLECLIAHACHVMIWLIWLISPSQKDKRILTTKERLYFVFLAPISVIALFGCLNLTFLIYDVKDARTKIAVDLQVGDIVPDFYIKTIDGLFIANRDLNKMKGTVINFVSSDCPYCKEQLPILNEIAVQLAGGSYRFINISPIVTPEMIQQSPAVEWVEDKEGELSTHFRIPGYPILFVIGANNKIVQIIPSVPNQLKALLLAYLKEPPKAFSFAD